MVIAPEPCPPSDVVFVIEKTANLGAYLDQSDGLRDNYILPTLEYFNGGSNEDKDVGFEGNGTMYALVAFMAADCDPEPAVTCFAQTTKISRFLTWLDQISFVGGAGEGNSHVAEGLSTAMQVFDDFQAQREPNFVAQKHCILICNSPPYPLPSVESLNYSGYMADQLAIMMKERGINLTVISPRKIPALLKLYGNAGGDLQLMQTENYAKDRRHLILLKGFHLEKSPLTPPKLESKPKVDVKPQLSPVNPSPKGLKRSASDNLPQGLPPPYKQTYRGSPINTTNQSSFVPTTNIQEMSKPTLSTSSHQNQSIPPETIWSSSNITRSNQIQIPITQTRDLTGIQQAPRVVPNTSQVINRSSGIIYTNQVNLNPNQVLNPQETVSSDFVSGAHGSSYNTINPSNPPIVQQATRNLSTHLQNFVQNDRRCIWAGTLEWQDRLKPGVDPNLRSTHEVQCRVLSCVNESGEVEVHAQYWPIKLTMPLVPKQFLSSFAGQYLKNPRKVVFQFASTTDGAVLLHNALSTGFAGCVQFTNIQCEIRLMIVLCTPDKHEYVGFIASDQNGLISAFKNASQQQQPQQQQPQPQQQQQHQYSSSGIIPRLPTSSTVASSGIQQQQQQQQSQMQNMEYEERLKNLMEIQQLQQNLEAARQRELHYKTQQQQQRLMHIQQEQQNIQQQQQHRMMQPQAAMSNTNPHLRHLLQPPPVQQQLRHILSQTPYSDQNQPQPPRNNNTMQ